MDEFFMRTALHDPALVEYQDLITETAGGKPVGNNQTGFTAGDLLEFLIDFKFTDRFSPTMA